MQHQVAVNSMWRQTRQRKKNSLKRRGSSKEEENEIVRTSRSMLRMMQTRKALLESYLLGTRQGTKKVAIEESQHAGEVATKQLRQAKLGSVKNRFRLRFSANFKLASQLSASIVPLYLPPSSASASLPPVHSGSDFD